MGRKRRHRGHYVSQLFTKAWEIEGKKLWVFDERRGDIRRRPAKLLLSDRNSTTAEYETRLNQLIETPIARELEKLTDASVSEGTVEIRDWTVYRALVLALHVQGARAATKDRNLDSLRELEKGIFAPDDVHDRIVRHWMHDKVLVRITTPESCPLFYPEVGFFGFLVRDPAYASGFSFAFGLPLHPHIVFCTMTTTADGEWLLRENARIAYLAQMSVGFSPHCQRWVVPPVLMDRHDERDVVDGIREMREASTRFAKAVGAHMDAIQAQARRMADSLGIDLAELNRAFG